MNGSRTISLYTSSAAAAARSRRAISLSSLIARSSGCTSPSPWKAAAGQALPRPSRYADHIEPDTANRPPGRSRPTTTSYGSPPSMHPVICR
ncbi:hypothetical protein [Actinocrispum sp. NPDC049592]|uniref:hypothetical protein n=1 Tax=Actinocrispum sp. NPDC049592 TaxID=3154835 RepID=UPI0034263FEC